MNAQADARASRLQNEAVVCRNSAPATAFDSRKDGALAIRPQPLALSVTLRFSNLKGVDMTFEQFQTNVQEWSEARGIYAHSSALAQALKAVSEVGELADATIKGNIDELRDAIGDVAVCLVNVAYMIEGQLDHDYIFDDAVHKRTVQEGAAGVAGSVGELSFELSRRNNNGVIAAYIDAGFHSLYVTAKANNLDFLDCCEAAWNEIKDRKGFLSPSGAFIKEGEV